MLSKREELEKTLAEVTCTEQSSEIYLLYFCSPKIHIADI